MAGGIRLSNSSMVRLSSLRPIVAERLRKALWIASEPNTGPCPLTRKSKATHITLGSCDVQALTALKGKDLRPLACRKPEARALPRTTHTAALQSSSSGKLHSGSRPYCLKQRSARRGTEDTHYTVAAMVLRQISLSLIEPQPVSLDETFSEQRSRKSQIAREATTLLRHFMSSASHIRVTTHHVFNNRIVLKTSQ